MRQLQSTTAVSITTAAVLSSAIFIVARAKAPFPILIADRILPGLGWVQIALLVSYAVFIAAKLVSTSNTKPLRLIIWVFFSSVFFLQFVAGVLGIEMLLMTGDLHIPIPAIVIAGPIYRGSRFFMPILFLSTIVLSGPAWCSYLCYFGPWDGVAAERKTSPGRRSKFWRGARITIFLLVPIAAFILRVSGVSPMHSSLIAIGFGVVGLGISAIASTQSGAMMHCAGYCPLGLAANILGKVSPFRIQIADSCTNCARCIPACRYGALDLDKIRRRRPGLTCTLCGDCIAPCPDGSIGYKFFRLNPSLSRALFIGVVAGLHACFLGIARI